MSQTTGQSDALPRPGHGLIITQELGIGLDSTSAPAQERGEEEGAREQGDSELPLGIATKHVRQFVSETASSSSTVMV